MPPSVAPGGRIDPADHLRRPWRVHALAAAEGLVLHDVWEVATRLPTGVPLARWVEVLRTERRSLLSHALFGLRMALGRVFGLDRGSAGFAPVYQEPEEQLSRIANRTVTAFLHLSLVDRRPGSRCTSARTDGSGAATCGSSSRFADG